MYNCTKQSSTDIISKFENTIVKENIDVDMRINVVHKDPNVEFMVGEINKFAVFTFQQK